MTIDGEIGLGFRRDIAGETLERNILSPDFLELAPENWIGMGGAYGKMLRRATEQYPVVCHGLSLSLGSPDSLNWDFLKKIKSFLDDHNVLIYSEHLSFNSCENAHFYDLLPIPFREDAVKHVSNRIRQVQDYLERQIAIENVSYYTPIAAEMSEEQFLNAVIEESGCQLLLDVNNVYVNGFNHGYDSKQFIDKMPLSKVAYMHIAGHKKVEDDLIIDTHGEDIIEPVYDLLNYVVEKIRPVPILLERDFNFPEPKDIQAEMDTIREIVEPHWTPIAVA